MNSTLIQYYVCYSKEISYRDNPVLFQNSTFHLYTRIRLSMYIKTLKRDPMAVDSFLSLRLYVFRIF